MKEQLVSNKTAKLAQARGFNVDCDNAYGIFGSSASKSHLGNKYHMVSSRWEGDTKKVMAPTQSLLQKWLRESVYCINVQVSWVDTLSDIYVYYILSTGNGIRPDSKFYHSYEEALEHGLQEALKLIIK